MRNCYVPKEAQGGQRRLTCEGARVGDDPEDPVSLTRLVLLVRTRCIEGGKDDSLKLTHHAGSFESSFLSLTVSGKKESSFAIHRGLFSLFSLWKRDFVRPPRSFVSKTHNTLPSEMQQKKMHCPTNLFFFVCFLYYYLNFLFFIFSSF